MKGERERRTGEGERGGEEVGSEASRGERGREEKVKLEKKISFPEGLLNLEFTH